MRIATMMDHTKADNYVCTYHKNDSDKNCLDRAVVVFVKDDGGWYGRASCSKNKHIGHEAKQHMKDESRG